MRPAQDRIGVLEQLHDQFNEADFGGKLMRIGFSIKRQSTKNGWYEFVTEKRNGPHWDAWYPRRDRLHRARIVMAEGCWEEDIVEATLLHEMVHQYQAEVLDMPPHHNKIFKSISRHLERKYGYEIR